MSLLQKKIAKLGRRDSSPIGFGRVEREKPRQMLLGVLVSDLAAGKPLVAAGADVAIACKGDSKGVKELIKGLASKDTAVGAWVSALDEAGAEALRDAGCDFVISSLEGTASAAVDTERMGQALAVDGGMEDNTLRALGPLGLDGLFVERSGGAMTLADQLELVRLASFSGLHLLATIEAGASVSELRVLRDSGVAVVVLPEGATADQVKAMVENLKNVPPPKRAKREGNEIALVPSVAAGAEEEHEHEEEDFE